MIALLTGFLRPFATPLAAVGGFVSAMILFSLYNALVENPAVIRDARADYVQQVKYDTLKFQLEAERRNRMIAEAAQKRFSVRLEAERKMQAEENQKLELEIANYEDQLMDAGRRCTLSDADIEWLRKH